MLYKINNKLGIIRVKGLDAKAFLQGQLTNDINLLDINNNLQLSAHLNHKGRMLASFIIVYYAENEYYLLTNVEIIPSILKRLGMFKLRSKITIDSINKSILLSDDFSNNYTLQAKLFDKYLIIDDNIDNDILTNNTLWLEFLLNNSLAMIYTASQELFIPQHVNLELINGVSFKKGCYTGQEIVARMHYLGKSKRRMYRFSILTTQTINIADSLISPAINNQEVGNIVEILAANDGYTGLCTCSVEHIHDVYHQLATRPLTITPFLFESNLRNG